MLRRPGGGQRDRFPGPGVQRRADVVGANVFVEVLVEHLGTGLRPMSDRDRRLRPTVQASGCRSQNDPISVTVAFAASMASTALTLSFGVG